MQPYVLGVDVGGTSVKLGLFSTDGALLEKWEIPTRTEENGAFILPDIADSIREKLSDRKIDPERVEGIGMGVPGPVDKEGKVHRCINLGWGILDVKQEMNRFLPEIPNVVAGNDANVATLGELWQGGGKGYDSAVMFTLGTGVGGGVVVDGRIIAGKNGGAGELGHIAVEPNETEVCACGKYGCLEQYASANGIVRMAKRMLAADERPSALREMPAFTAREICNLAREGEPFAADVVDRFGEYMGRGMSYMSCAVDPDVYIIGGGMSRAGELLIRAISGYYRRYAFHVSTETPMVLAELGNDAGIYGGAKLVLP